jgi:hypothetical protein
MNLKILAASAAIAGALATGGLVAPGTAQASTITDHENAVCNALDASPTRSTLIDITNDAIKAHLDGGYYRMILMGAVTDICPDHYSLVSSFVQVLF